MKKYSLLLAIVLLIIGGANAQKNLEDIDFEDLKNKKLVSEFVWSDYKAFKDYPVVPEEYKDEPAVYLEKEFYYSFKAKTKSGHSVLKIRNMYRWIIKIQESQGIEDFSTLKFYAFDPNKDQIGIRLIKSNGKIVNVDDSRLLDDEDESGKYKKISIPNIEVGDIIDYYRYDNYKKNFYSMFTIYSPSREVFVDDFPIVHQYMEFDLINNVYMLFSEFNGAPKAKVSRNDKGVDIKIVYESNMVDKNDIKDIWIDNLKVFPAVRYQVGAGRMSEQTMYEYFIDKDDFVTFKRSKAMLKDRLVLDYASFPVDKYGKKRNKATNKRILKSYEGKKAPSTIEKLEFMYNFTRTAPYSSEYLLDYFAEYLEDQGIDYTIFHYVPRYMGDYENVLSRSDIKTGLRFMVAGKQWYYSNNRWDSVLGEVPPYFDNVKGFGISLSDGQKHKKGTIPVREVITPTSTPDNNSKTSVYSIEIEGENLQVSVNESYKGQIKRKAQYYFPSDLSRIEDLQKYELKEKSILKLYPDYKEDYKNYLHVNLLDSLDDDEDMTRYKRVFKSTIENNYDDGVKDLNAFEIKNTGRYLSNPVLEIESNYKLEGFIKKMGNDYLVDAGGIIGSQVNLDDDQRERKVAIAQDYTREFVNDISIVIPDGYAVEGLEKLNVSVDNSNGRFIAETIVEGNILRIKTTKSYKKLDSPVEEWPEYLDFLDAAYDFTQQKVLFKKQSS